MCKLWSRNRIWKVVLAFIFLSIIITVVLINGELLRNLRRLEGPGVHLERRGGLGNQLFIYACLYSLAKKLDLKLYLHLANADLDPSRRFDRDKRPNVLDYFNIPLNNSNILNTKYWWVYSAPTKILRDEDLYNLTYSKSSSLFFSDYCQSELYFEDYKKEILRQFQIKVEKLMSPQVIKWLDIINSTEASVAVHVRRGDYGNESRVPISYQKEAMIKIIKMLDPYSPTFFIFSDEDTNKLKDEFGTMFLSRFEGQISFVSDPEVTNSVQEFYLMSRCSHQIIPASSFGWWAAYLNKNPGKIVIASHWNREHWKDRRMFKKWMYRNNYYPKEWILIDPFEH